MHAIKIVLLKGRLAIYKNKQEKIATFSSNVAKIVIHKFMTVRSKTYKRNKKSSPYWW